MIKLFTDSTCDLSEDLLERYQISVIPLYIQLEEESYRDGMEIDPDRIYEWSDKTGKTPKTSAPGIVDVIEALQKYDQEGMEILFMGIAEEMSTTGNVVRLAAEELQYAKVYVINSKSLSTGTGLQVLKAANYIQTGMAITQIIQKIEEDRGKIRAGFVIDTLTYLHRGGRCSAVTALLAGAIKIKPQIAVRDGKMVIAKKFRGNIKSVVKKYVKELEPDILNAEPEHIFITHSGGLEESAEEIYTYLKAMGRFQEIHITRAGSVIASHCGPKTLGVLFYGKEEMKKK